MTAAARIIKVMSWPWLRQPPRPRASQRKPRDAVGAGCLEAIGRGEAFEHLPFGGYAGEALPTPQPAPAPPEPLRFEPPPWTNPDGSLDFSLAPPETDPAPNTELSALAEIKSREVGDDWPPPPGPPLVLEPLRRPEFPPADWRAEERARAARDSVVELEPAKSLQPRPAPRKRRIA